jgi:phosphoglucomutase/phosphomannomutase
MLKINPEISKVDEIKELLAKAQEGFATLSVSPIYIKNALEFLNVWLNDEEFKNYYPQIKHLIVNGYWDYLLNSFYQIIPFGTGGRRGEVGVGPNRINPWAIKASAQGHSQYLLKRHGDVAKNRGVVFAYDVREFVGNKYFNDQLPNPLKNLTSKDLALTSARVYAANGIKVYLFDSVRTTPELSFAIRYLQTIAGVMISASHNPPDHNGKKIYDEYGGQLIPPNDEELVIEVTEKVQEIRDVSYESAIDSGLIKILETKVDEEYIKAASSVSLSSARDLKIVYTPLHGCGASSVYKILGALGFDVFEDPKTSNASGRFENITFNIPNPEVIQSFDTTLVFAKEINADIILSSDPDADRIGTMVRHHDNWIFLNGNEIAAILAQYVITKKNQTTNQKGVLVKTTVTTNLLTKICEKNQVKIIAELLVGFKYVAGIMNELEDKGEIADFLLGCEESHGYLSGNYARDKDAATAAIWLSELAAELKKENKTLVDYLDEIYLEYGYFKNYLTEIRIQGAAGKEQIDNIQLSLRKHCPPSFGKYKITKLEDCLLREPIVSETDKAAKDVLIFHLESVSGTESMRVTVRPSGTESKIKMYFEIGTAPASPAQLAEVKTAVETIVRDLEKAVMLTCYQIIGIAFPERGFLLFWQLPLNDKLKYFAIEPEIEKLKNVPDKDQRRTDLLGIVAFLGSDPIEKINPAFEAKNGVSVLKYLELD